MRAIVLSAALLTGCAQGPEWYTIPPQHGEPQNAPGAHAADYVEAAQAGADAFFVKDIKGSEGFAWRWTLEEPELRFQLGKVQNRRLNLNLTVHDKTFRDTGPLRLAIFVNDQALDRVVYDSPGDKVYEKPVPESMLRANGENRVRIRVLNPWKAPDPGVRLGFLFRSAGILER